MYVNTVPGAMRDNPSMRMSETVNVSNASAVPE
jgi:hypothetical protein